MATHMDGECHLSLSFQVPAILTMQQEEEVKEPSMLMKSTFNYK